MRTADSSRAAYAEFGDDSSERFAAFDL